MKSNVVSRIKNKLARVQQRFNTQKWPNGSIVIFCPPNSPKFWTAQSLKTGVGGSEVAVIHLSQQWAQMGYSVNVYNNCGSGAGQYGGVEYRDYHAFNPFDEFATLIVWRMPWRMHFPNRARRALLDLHETLIPEQRTFKLLKGYDKILVKSQYHRQLFSEIPDSQIEVIPNGVEASYEMLLQVAKEPFRLIYASSYVRGLEQMLEYGWPAIHQACPQAELHIYYGWSLPDTPSTEQQAWKAKMLRLMEQPGVFEHGRVGQDELLKAKATAAIHYYGCTFQEIDCISVRESALVGCVPVTTNYAVLDEKQYCKTISGRAKAPETHRKIAQHIIELLENPQQLAQIRTDFAELARRETWDSIAEQWIKFIN